MLFPPLLIRPITFLACGAVIAFVDATSTTAKTSPENVTSLSSVIIPRLFQVVCLENFFANLFEFNSYERFGDYKKKKYKFVYVRLGRPHKWKIDDLTSLIGWEWLRNAQKRKNTRAKRAKLLFLPVKFVTLLSPSQCVASLFEWNSSLRWS